MAVQNIKPTPFESEAMKRKGEMLGVAKTAEERATERAKAANERLNRLRGGFGGQRESVLNRQKAARLEEQRAGGRNVARAVASTPFSGATSSIVAAESVQERLDKQQQEAALRGEAALSQLQATQLGQEEAGIQSVEKAEDIALSQTQQRIKAEEDLPEMAEQHTRNLPTETTAVNEIITRNEGVVYDTPGKAAGEIEARALTYVKTDPKLHKMLMYVADAVRRNDLPKSFSSTGGIGSGTSISLTTGEWPWLVDLGSQDVGQQLKYETGGGVSGGAAPAAEWNQWGY